MLSGKSILLQNYHMQTVQSLDQELNHEAYAIHRLLFHLYEIYIEKKINGRPTSLLSHIHFNSNLILLLLQ